MGNQASTRSGQRRYNYDDRYRRQRPTATYSRHSGGGMGYFSSSQRTNNSCLIGRDRLTQQISLKNYVPEITAPQLGKVVVRKCGNEGQHHLLDEVGKTTLKFLQASISFIPYAKAAGADMRNTSFIFAQPGREFAIISGNGDWEFYFSKDGDGHISGVCVRKSTFRYVWDGVKSAFRLLWPVVPPLILALAAP